MMANAQMVNRAGTCVRTPGTLAVKPVDRSATFTVATINYHSCGKFTGGRQPYRRLRTKSRRRYWQRRVGTEVKRAGRNPSGGG